MVAAGGSREERWSLAGTTALVTGGSKGIGHAIVEELAGFGARVHTCSRNAAELEECRRRWAEKKLQVTVSVCDVSVRAEREKLMETVKETFDGKLDVLVNNAAGNFVRAAAECTAEDYSHTMATNLESSFHLSQLARPLLLNASVAGGGSIVNISSIGGSLGFPGLALYGISKVWIIKPPPALATDGVNLDYKAGEMATYSPSKKLESLNIHGNIGNAGLPTWIQNLKTLSKITLCETFLSSDYALRRLGNLPGLRCLRLRRNSCTDSRLTFYNGEFQKLKFLLIEASTSASGSGSSNTFQDGAAPMLQKIVWWSLAGKDDIISSDTISGIKHLPKLEEVELKRCHFDSRPPLEKEIELMSIQTILVSSLRGLTSDDDARS